MAKGMYFGVGGVPRKVSKMYFGVGGVPRKVKKVFFGVGGSPRLAYSAEPGYAGTATPLSVARTDMGAASNNNYAIFFSGDNTADDGASVTNVVDAYNTALTRSNAPTASSQKSAAGARNPSYAVFSGGQNSTSTNYYSGAYAYNDALARTVLSEGLYQAVIGHKGASVGDWAIFIGGWRSPDTNVISGAMSAFNSALARVANQTYAFQRTGHGGARTPSYALFAGGLDDRSQLDVYDAGLTRYTSTMLSFIPSLWVTGASVGDYAVFMTAGSSPLAEAFDNLLVRHAVASIESHMSQSSGVSLEGWALFVGGSGTPIPNYAYMYDTTLTQSNINIPLNRSSIIGASVGNHALFAGGYSSGSRLATVDVIDA